MSNKVGITAVVRLLTLTLLVYLNGCKDDDFACNIEDVEAPVTIDCMLTRDLDSVRTYLHGRWNWLQEERRQRGQTAEYLTPGTQGYSRAVEFQSDTATFSKCNKLDGIYKYSLVPLKEITGTNFPEDEYTVLVLYNPLTNVRVSYVPVRVCEKFLILEGQFVSSVAGEETWRRN